MTLHVRAILKILGIIVAIESLFFLIPFATSLLLRDGQGFHFILASAITATVGLALVVFNQTTQKVRKRDIYIIVTFGWVLVSLFGALPYVTSGAIPDNTHAFFESVSGFTTTGATILIDIESLPPSMLLWRALTQWIGGMGIVVLMIAIIPLLGVGGMQLFNAESPGVMIDRLKPRVKETALIMWIVYASLTVTAFVLLLMGGLGVLDALAHSFTTLSSGGFSTKQESIAAFGPYVQYVIIVFMLLAGTNYALLYAGLKGKLHTFFRNEEWKAYIGILAGSTAVLFAYAVAQGGATEETFRHILFQVVSITTTTGFATADYTAWAEPLLYVIIALMFVGGMSGSTAGGVKVVRHVLLVKGILVELRKQLYPDAILPLRFNGMMVSESMLHRVLAFSILYLLTAAVGFGVLLFAGVDGATAFGAVAATLGNIGPGIGAVGPAGHYADFSATIQLFLSFLMIVGRLELFTVLILFTPYFWRKF